MLVEGEVFIRQFRKTIRIYTFRRESIIRKKFFVLKLTLSIEQSDKELNAVFFVLFQVL